MREELIDPCSPTKIGKHTDGSVVATERTGLHTGHHTDGRVVATERTGLHTYEIHFDCPV